MASTTPRTDTKGLQLYPVFCTTDIPTDILEKLVTSFRNNDVGNPDGDDYLRFLSPEDAADIKSIQTAHRAPMSPIAPFYDWSIKEIYDFWLAHVRPPLNAVMGRWTAFTFLILDGRSAEDHRCVLCCNAPDQDEKGDEEILKSVRMPFAEAAVKMVSFEMMTVAPSESNKDQVLSAVPPVWMDTTESPPGELRGKVATPEYARAAKRRVFLAAEA